MSEQAKRYVPLLLVIGSLTASFVALELAIRVHGALADESLDDLQQLQRPVPREREATLGGIIQVSQYPKIIYELRPDLSVEFKGVRITTNAEGLRDREYDLDPTSGTVRIVGLGDSVMFGWGVPEGADFLSLIERQLNEEYPERNWEIINMAVPGYNAAMELETLIEKGLVYQPDIVTMDFLPNDIAPPNFVPETDFLSPKRSFLVEFIRNRLGRIARPPGLRPQTRLDDEAERDPSRVPAAFRDMVGWEAYGRVVTELGELSERHGFDVLVTCVLGWMSSPARNAILTQGFPIACTWDEQRDYLVEHGLEATIPARLGSPLAVSDTDAHPSGLGHAIAADVVYESLVQEGFVRRQVVQDVGDAR